MKSTILAIFLSLAAPAAFAVQVDVTCFPKAWGCGPGGCAWQTVPMEINRQVNLARDPNYPSSQFPYEVYRGRMQTAYDRHFLTLDLLYTTQDALHPLKVFANLDAGNVMAETSGLDSIDIALRNANYGRGFLCTNFRLLN